ncbi:hypothetical protein HDV05_005010 [Chytridiales sp. JEL 0842]|nr:hypothetical protein HDV05_005010 [Chytridiales sp. JEL 0842]
MQNQPFTRTGHDTFRQHVSDFSPFTSATHDPYKYPNQPRQHKAPIEYYPQIISPPVTPPPALHDVDRQQQQRYQIDLEEPASFLSVITTTTNIPTFTTSSSTPTTSVLSSDLSTSTLSASTASSFHLNQPKYFKTRLCKSILYPHQYGPCTYGPDRCFYAHSRSELIVKEDQPTNYKRKECRDHRAFLKGESAGPCPRGDKCTFAHGKADILTENLPETLVPKFKTQLCKIQQMYLQGKIPHPCRDGPYCFFAHSVEELRESPPSSAPSSGSVRHTAPKTSIPAVEGVSQAAEPTPQTATPSKRKNRRRQTKSSTCKWHTAYLNGLRSFPCALGAKCPYLHVEGVRLVDIPPLAKEASLAEGSTQTATSARSNIPALPSTFTTTTPTSSSTTFSTPPHSPPPQKEPLKRNSSYKTRLCISVGKKTPCTRLPFCGYAHSTSELQQNPTSSLDGPQTPDNATEKDEGEWVIVDGLEVEEVSLQDLLDIHAATEGQKMEAEVFTSKDGWPVLKAPVVVKHGALKVKEEKVFMSVTMMGESWADEGVLGPGGIWSWGTTVKMLRACAALINIHLLPSSTEHSIDQRPTSNDEPTTMIPTTTLNPFDLPHPATPSSLALDLEAETTWTPKAQVEIDSKTKPPGSLGLLEDWSRRLIILQRTLKPRIETGKILVFAADHGLADEGVSQYPKAVTREMLKNMASGGAAINALVNSTPGLSILLTDVGVDTDSTYITVPTFKTNSPHGSSSALRGDAMTPTQLSEALCAGFETAWTVLETEHVQALGIGELGISNTAVSSCLLAAVNGLGAREVTGAGTGVVGAKWEAKVKVVEGVLKKHEDIVERREWKEVLRCMGGLEIAAMTGAYIAASRHPSHPSILVDGFISTIAFLMALKCFPSDVPALRRAAFLAHTSSETGMKVAVKEVEKAMGVVEGTRRPVFELGMRLGEGTGAALAFSVLKSAAHVASDMNTFAGAGVSTDA